MMRRLRRLRHDERGVSATEFAAAAPFFILLLIAIAQLGLLFFANAGLRNALAEGARYATLYPRPSEQAIKAKINAARWGLDPARLTVNELAYGTSNSSPYATISMSYNQPLNFIFFEVPPVTLAQSRRVYLQPEAP